MSYKHNFVTYLETLQEDRGALAALRRGLGQPPGNAPEMFPYVVNKLPEKAYPGSWTEKTYYLVASLYALHPESAAKGNFGTHFAHTLDLKNPDNNTAVERRFTALLTAHPEDLPHYLRQAVSFLKSKDVPVNWHQLMRHLLQWNHPERAVKVQKSWATQFWRRQKNDDDMNDK